MSVDSFSIDVTATAAFVPVAGPDPPGFVVEISTSGPNDAVQSWHDITPYVLKFNTRRSKQRQLQRFEAGSMDISLRNTDRRFDPTFSASPFYPNLLPLRQIRAGFISLTDQKTYWIFTGYVERWPQTYVGPTWSQVDITCVDGFELVSNHVLASSYATLTTAQSSNRDLTFSAVQFGYLGDSTTIAYLNLGGTNTLSVNVTGVDITVNLATTTGTITSTANDVMAAVQAFVPAAALVTVALAAGSTGTGTVQAFARTSLSGGTFVQQTTGNYIKQIFQYMNWSGHPDALTEISIGQSLVQAQAIPNDGSVLAIDQIYAASDTEDGQFFFDTEGDPVFLDRAALASTPYRNPVMTLTDFPNNTTTFGYTNIQVDWDKDLIYNDVRVTRNGGITQISDDATSDTSFFTRSLAVSTLNTSDADAKNLGDALLSRYKNPQLRFEPLTVFPGMNAAFWNALLQLDLMKQIIVTRTPPGGGAVIYQQVALIGIEIDAPAGPIQGVTWTLSIDPSGSTLFFILDDLSFGTLDNNAVGY